MFDVMRKILFSLVVLLACMGARPSLHAQLVDKGAPASWKGKMAQEAPVMRMPRVDLAPLVAEDAVNDAMKSAPWRFGYSHAVDITPQTAGLWESLPNGDQVWRMAFDCPDALSVNLLFSEYELPEGAYLHLYSADKRELQGAYTHLNNSPAAEMGTTPVQSSRIVVEYYEPLRVQGRGRLRISTVVHGYRSIFNYAADVYKGLNTSGKCNNDVRCPLAAGWEDQINSVAIIVVNGSGACTGALVNNTSNDGTPYFLSANHCGNSSANWVFRFNWDSPTPVCAQNAASGAPPTPYNQVTGGVRRAANAGSDFALHQMNATPTGDVYYAGWDRSGTIPTGASVGIHHPDGDVKKFSVENQALTQVTWQSALCWRVANWDNGTTEGGSSGSPLFDSNKRIIGQLFGGGAACNGLVNNGQPDYYGRFDISWNTGTTAATRLRDWLDPAGSAPNFIDGYNPNAPTAADDASARNIAGIDNIYCNNNTVSGIITVRNFGSVTLSSVAINYGVQGGTNNVFNWTGTLAAGASTTVALPSVTANSGSNIFYAYTSMPNGNSDTNNANDTTRFNFEVITGGLTAQFVLVPDCYSSETSWKVFNNTTTFATGGPYTDAQNPANVVAPLCLPVGCYTLRVYDSYGDGLRGNYGSAACTRNGTFYVLGPQNDTLARLASTIVNSDFGDSISYNFCVTAPAVPTAAFTAASATTICQNGNVNFTNQSAGATSYLWEFAGGTPATSTATSPSVSYSTAGTYGVTLTATNSLGSASSTQSSLITVVANNIAINGTVGANNITTAVSGGTAPFTYAWSNNAGNVSSITPATTGSYSVTVTDANGCSQSETYNFTLPIGISENVARNTWQATLMPNPTRGNSLLRLSNASQQNISIQLLTTTGQLVEQKDYNTENNDVLEHSLDLNNLPAGLYLLQIRSNSHSQILKVVKQ